MFGFALWDSTQQILFLARDPFGIKPLYFVNDGTSIKFASQVKALLAGGGIDTTLSPAAQTGFCLWGHVPEPHTLYSSIKALPAGHAMVVSRGGFTKTWMYHDPLGHLMNPTPDGEPVNVASTGQALRDAIEESVRYHMVADVPVGCFLSSGIDSNVLAGLAAQAVV